ncbi:J domain-containing protein [Psidium guajava]|nr:J domain-containing protein [Psidium guajava]
MTAWGDSNPSKDEKWPSSAKSHLREKQESLKLYGIFVFGLIGSLVTTFAVLQLRRNVDWFHSQIPKSQASGKTFRSAFQEEAWRRYNQRLEEAYEEEMERVERIRRMQRIFNRERTKYKRSYDRWSQNDPGAYNYHFQQDDWYWKAQTSYGAHWTNYKETSRERSTYPLSHHYSVLGLDRSRRTPYTEAEIKTAFRAKAKEFHPDQHQVNKEAAEAKFKEVMISYEAIKQERRNKMC